MRIYIIGAGATGSVAAHFLSQIKEVEAIVCGDINLKKARQFLPIHGKINLQTLDASQKNKIVNAIKGFDLVINASAPSLNLTIMEACLEAGINYQDLASDWRVETKVEQLEYHEKFKEKGLIGLINASASPGVTNLMAKILSAKFDRVDSIKIRLLETVSSDVPFTAWSKEAAFDEATYLPYIWERGHFVRKENFAEEELFNFPEPFTNRRSFIVAQEEVVTIPLYIKAKRVDLKAAGSEIEFLYTLFKLGLLQRRLVRIGNALISPYEFMIKAWPDVVPPAEVKKIAASNKLRDAHFWTAVIASGSLEKKKKEWRADILFPNQSEINKLLPGTNYISYAAGLSASIFAMTISSLQQKGVYPPEAIDTDTANDLMEKLKKAGIKIETTETSIDLAK